MDDDDDLLERSPQSNLCRLIVVGGTILIVSIQIISHKLTTQNIIKSNINALKNHKSLRTESKQYIVHLLLSNAANTFLFYIYYISIVSSKITL